MEKIDFAKSEEYYFTIYQNDITRDEYKNSIIRLKKFTNLTYIDYHHELVNEIVDLNKVRDIDETDRGILASILESFYGASFILVLYNIWQRLNVLWLNTELHNEIFQLSYTAKENRWTIE
ncbi:hypothetical protein LF65_01972 [Clostridium beijerinckii]|uniref:Uncharacterized protein n=1 Tax=Clostridium beijerinckii TaxID=1520 RepID=A0A0B5QCA4_CLOBE|nr:hypothetical protein [Clostridium beijerinckii]AJG98570.1 hypothetical protein LF65_01972 [Clostridium beijerinckii]